MDPLVARLDKVAGAGRSLARWSVRLLGASFLFVGWSPVVTTPTNIFDSLANQLRDATLCAARAPRWLSVIALVIAFRLILAGSPDVRLFRRKIVWGSYLLSILSGGASVSIAALVLPVMSNFWSWVFIVTVSFAFNRMEKIGTDRLLDRSAPEPPNRAEASSRLITYEGMYPNEVTTASPLLYAYSVLDRDQIAQQFLELGTGNPSLATRLIMLVLIAAIYPHIPTPNVEPLGRIGFIGCTYTDLYGFFRIAQENIALTVAAAILLLAVSPLTVLLAYVRFMREWRFPSEVRFEVLRREWGFAKRHLAYQPAVAIVVGTILGMTLLWVSAWLATRLNSALAGLFVLLSMPFAVMAVVGRLLVPRLLRTRQRIL